MGAPSAISSVDPDDPWVVPALPRRDSWWAGPASAVAVWLLGTVPAMARVEPNGVNGREGAIALGVLGALLVCALQARSRPLAAVFVALAAGCAVGGVVPNVGRFPVVVTAVGVLVSHAALVSWSLPGPHPRRRVPRATLAVPFVAGAGLEWYRSGRLGPTLVLLALALTVVEAYGRWPGLSGRADARVDRVLRAVSQRVGSLVLFVALVPIVFLPGLVAGRVSAWRRARLQSTSSWRAVAIGVDDQRRDAPYPFASTPVATVRRRLTGGLALVLLLAGFAIVDRPDDADPPLAAGRPTVPAPSAPGETAPRVLFAQEFAAKYSDLPAYQGVEWADALQTEQTMVPVDHFEGQYVNVRDGHRVTLEPEACSCPAASVWITGSSAMWGIGQRDDHTIASELVRAAERRGMMLSVENLGQRASVLSEQIDDVEARLRSGPKPDLVVFHTGFNELGNELAQAMSVEGEDSDLDVFGGTQKDFGVAGRMADLEAVNQRVDEYLRSGKGLQIGADAAERFAAQQDRMGAIAAAFGIDVLYFFQPDALASIHQLDPYEAISGVPTAIMAKSPLAVALDEATQLLGQRVVDLRHVFDDERAQVFLGLVHHNEVAARRLAAVMLPTILDRLDGPSG